MNQAYSTWKVARHPETLAGLRANQPVVPRQVQLILSDLCNHDCAFCAYRTSEGFSSAGFGEDTGKGFTMNPNRMIPVEKAIEILEDLAELGVPAVQFTGGGEPTVHPRHLGIFARALGLGLEAALVTNGNLLRAGWEQILPRFAWVRVSLDAGSAETYSRMRRVRKSAFDKAIRNLSALADEVSKRGTPCRLGTSFIVTNDNWREVSAAAGLAKSAGARHLRVAACYTTQGAGYYAEPLAVYHEVIAEAQARYADESFEVLDMFASRVEDLEARAPDFKRCGYQQLNVYVAGNQKVYRCCTTSYTPHGEVGDLREQRFAEWWADPKTLTAYRNFDARTCASCPFREKNRVLNYLLEPTVEHENFV